METLELYFFKRSDWRNWLSVHHESARGVALLFYNKESGKPSLAYSEAVEEALCFGWIDGVIKNIDAEKYIRRFMPRTNRYNWSPTNRERAEKMIREGKMTLPGLMKIGDYAKTGQVDWDHTLQNNKEFHQEFSPELRALLKENPVAESNFRAFPPSQQKRYIMWIMSAKTETTRLKRMKEAMDLLEKNQKNLMK